MSSTPAERKALVVVAAIAALGVVARVVRARDAHPEPTPAETRALEAQIARVDSARKAERAGGAGRSTRTARRSPSREGAQTRAQAEAPRAIALRAPVDLDAATAAEIEGLPWVGPALAARIVEARDKCGPFGSLEGLTRVYGIGEGMARRLAPHVTFSTASRPIGAGRAPGCQGSAKSAASRRRGRS